MSDETKKQPVTTSGEKTSGGLQRYSPFEEMERMFEDILHRRFFAPLFSQRFTFPELPSFADVSTSIDMFEDGGSLVIKAELPGLKKDEINVDFTGDVLTISGNKKTEEKTERKDFHRVERSFGSFSRKLRLPVEVQIDKAKASFKDGVLEIRVPKAESEKPTVKKITVE